MSAIDPDRCGSRSSRDVLQDANGQVTSNVNLAPGLPRTRAQGLAHGEPRGHAARGSNRGLRLAG